MCARAGWTTGPGRRGAATLLISGIGSGSPRHGTHAGQPGADRPGDLASSLDLTGIAGFAAAMIALLLFLFGLPRLEWYLLGISVARAGSARPRPDCCCSP